MSSFFRPALALPDASDEDPRVGSLLTLVDDQKIPDQTQLAIIGLDLQPSDDAANGAANRIRKYLYPLTPDLRDFKPFVKTLRQTIDLGNIVTTDDEAESLEALAKVIRGLRRREITVIILSDSNQTTYGHFLGYAESKSPVTVISFDAHSGVSLGEPGHDTFRKVLEHPSGNCRHYHVAGPQTFSISRRDFEFINENVGDVHWAEDINGDRLADLFSNLNNDLMCSFDADVVHQASALAVQHPNPHGLSHGLYCHAAFDAGRCSKTTSIDFVGIDPTIDDQDATARLVALAVWKFIHGYAQRW